MLKMASVEIHYRVISKTHNLVPALPYNPLVIRASKHTITMS